MTKRTFSDLLAGLAGIIVGWFSYQKIPNWGEVVLEMVLMTVIYALVLWAAAQFWDWLWIRLAGE